MDDKRIEQALENAFIKMIQSDKVFDIPYHERISVSEELKVAYRRIDHTRLQEKVTELLEEELAKKIVNKVVTEMGTDIKKLMCNNELRDDFRFYLRSGIQKILDKVREPDDGS